MRPVDIDNIEAEMDKAPINRLVHVLRREADDLANLLVAAKEVQWEAAPRLAEPSTGRKSEGDAPANPTADIALDGQRLALRAQIIRSERMLREAVILMSGIRMGLERALDTLDTP